MRASVCVCLAASAGCAGSGVGRDGRDEHLRISDEIYVDELTHEPVYAVSRPSGAVAFAGPGPPDAAAAHARELVARDDAALLRRGAAYADAFERGDAEEIWSSFNERARMRSDSEAFERLVAATRAQIGRRILIRGEYVEAAGHGVAFLRDALYERAPNGVVLEVSFAPDGKSLTDFAVYRAETRPIRLKKVEDADVAR